MVIEEGILTKVELRDLDDEGKVVIPGNVKKVLNPAFEEVEDVVTSVEFMEGVEIIEHETFAYCTNLQFVELPRSLHTLGNEGGFMGVFPSKNNIEIKFNSYPKMSKFSLGRERTKEYISSCLDEIEKLLKSTSMEDISKAMECYDSIIYHKNYYSKYKNVTGEESIIDKYDRISLLLIAKLREKINGKETGQIFIEKSLKENVILNRALLQYDAYAVYEKLGLTDYFKPVRFEYCDAKAKLLEETKEIQFDTNNAAERFKKWSIEREIGVLDINLLMMHMLRHEASHLYFKTRSKDSENVSDVLAYYDNQLQTADDGYATGRMHWHIAEHDFLPDEIGADINALDMLGDSLIEKYGFKLKKTSEYIQMHKDKRMAKVYERYGLKSGDNYRIAILERALDPETTELSSSEKKKVEEILEEYKKLDALIVSTGGVTV